MTSSPAHIAIIMDGNGRWAESRGLKRTDGHKQGAKALEKILGLLEKKGVQYMTLYAFSTENWKRPKEEVDTLLHLFEEYLDKDISKLAEKNVRVHFIGRKERFPKGLQEKMVELEEKTAPNSGYHLILALDYGGRDEICRAMMQVGNDVRDGVLKASDITEEVVSSYLDTKGIPDPDLVIRTSGEMRLSGFLLWQLAYAEMYFTEVNWPDFSEEELDKAISVFKNRKRRFGKV